MARQGPSHRFQITALVVVTALSVMACSPRGSSNTVSPSRGVETPALQRPVSGSPDDWLTALCKPGEYYQNAKTRTAMPGAVDGAMCMPRVSASNPNMPSIWISQFDSEFKMRNALPARLAKYAAATRHDGLIWVFSIMDDDPSPLRPLEQFGFTIESVAGTGAAPSAPTYAPSAAPVPPPASAPGPATSGGSGASQTVQRFQSNTGNIVCELASTSGEGTAVCEVRQHSYKPEVKPGCQTGWVNAFALRQGRAPVVNCYADTVFQTVLPVLGDGRPLTAGSITCVVDENTQVSCKDATTGHYFRASRQEYRYG